MIFLANSLVASGEIELMSMTVLPFESPAATPSAPNRTASTCGVSGTIKMMASDSCAACLPDWQTIPPPATSSGAIGPTSCRNRRCPAASRWPAIGRPMVPRPMKPISIIQCSFSAKWSGFEYLRGMPSQAVDRRRPRLVFASDPAAIADRVEMAEQEGIVDLAGAGLVAAGIVGKLDVRDAAKMFLEAPRDIALHHLHVVDVVLDEEIARSDIADELNGLFGSVQEEAGNIERVDRLDQEPDLFARQRGCGVSQILHQHFL